MPTGYTPQSSIDRRKALMNQLRQTPMNDTGKKTDWGRGLAHMLRQYQAGQMGREQEAEISRNSEIEQSEMAALMSRVGNPEAQAAQAAPDFSSMAITEGMDQGMVQGAQNNAASTPALPAFADMPATSPMAQALKQQQVLGNAASDRAAAQKMTELEYGRGSDAIKVGQQGKNRLSEILAQGVEQRLTQGQKPTIVGDGSTLVNPEDKSVIFDNPETFDPNSGKGGSGFGNTPIWTYDENGNMIPSFVNNGQLSAGNLPEGSSGFVGPGSVNTTVDMGGERINPFQASIANKLKDPNAPKTNSFENTLGPEQKLEYLEKKEKIKSDAALWIKSEGAKVMLAKDKPVMRKSLRDSKGTVDTINNNIFDAMEMIENGYATTGFFGTNIADIKAGTDAYALKMSLQPILANVAFTTLKGMRDSSVSGASGLGQLNEREYEALQNSWAGVSQASDKKSLIKALNDVKARSESYYRSSLELYSDLYQEKFEYETGIDRTNEVGADAHKASIGRQARIAELEARQAKIKAAQEAANGRGVN